MKTWYELWSKAGASPTYRVENVDVYLSGLNWVSNWVQNHFFNKISDYLLSLFFIIIICYFFLANSKKLHILKKIFIFSIFIILILLIEWFLKSSSFKIWWFYINRSIYLHSIKLIYGR